MKIVFAVVDVATLGMALGATGVLKAGVRLTAKEATLLLGKTVVIETASNIAGYSTGFMANEAKMPVPLVIALSILAGSSVGKFGTKLAIKNGAEEGIINSIKNNSKSIPELLNESLCSKTELYKYLSKNISPDAAESFAKNGSWPSGVLIPKNSSVLNSDGSLNWLAAAKGGYTLDSNGNAIKIALTDTKKVNSYLPEGKIIDRYGDSSGRYVSPTDNGVPYSYEQRSLPYIEDISNYHQYKVTGDFSKLDEYIENCSDITLKNKIVEDIEYYYNGDLSKVVVNVGEIAKVEGWGIGGGIQYEFPIKIEDLEKLGLLKEIKKEKKYE